MNLFGRNDASRFQPALMLLCWAWTLSVSVAETKSLTEELTIEQWRECLRDPVQANDLAAVDRIAAALQHDSSLIRRMAAHQLGNLGVNGVELKAEALRHSDAYVRGIALEHTATSELGGTEFIDLLMDRDLWVRSEMRKRLLAMNKENPTVQQLLIRAMHDGWGHSAPEMRIFVYNYVNEWKDRPSELKYIITAGLEDSDPAIRTLAKRAAWPFRAQQEALSNDLEVVQSLDLPIEGWRFQLDPQQIGHTAGWYEPEYIDQDWGMIRIGDVWQDQGYNNYVGAAWYRREIEVPESFEGTLGFYFDAVDESAWVWINGKYAGRHDMGPSGWNVPFRVNATGLLQPGETNHIAIRVANTTALGGIYGVVQIQELE